MFFVSLAHNVICRCDDWVMIIFIHDGGERNFPQKMRFTSAATQPETLSHH